MPLVSLEGKVALVTGAGTRVGSAIAGALAAAGCDLVVHHATSRVGADEVAARARALGRRALVVRADLTSRHDLDALVTATLGFADGRLDLLVHNAANFERTPPSALDAAAWDRALALNATAPYLLSIALAQALAARRGSIVIIGCISATRPFRNYLPYSVSKAAAVHLAKGLASALAPDVRVNAVSPGTVLPPDDYDDDKRALLAKAAPLGRVGEAEDVARAVLFFAQNDFVTGQELSVDGGRLLV